MSRIVTLFFIAFSSLAYGQNMLTVREVYDFNVGDVFEYDNSRIFATDEELKLKMRPDGGGFRKTILARRDSKNLDSIIYKVKIDEYFCILKNKQRYYKTSSKIIDELYTSLNSCVCDEHKHWDLNHYTDTVYFHPNWKVKVMEYGGMFDVCNGFYISMGKGIGLVYFHFMFSFQQEKLIYYKKGNVECGTHDTNFEQKTTAIPSGQVFYPNPVVSTLYFWEPLASGSLLSIIDCTGKEVLKMPYTPFLSQIDVSHLAKGLYYVKLDNGEQKSVYKLVKQ